MSTKGQVKIWSYLDEFLELRDEVLRACDEVFLSGQLILGERVRSFEEAVSSYVGVRAGVGVNSGTDALHLALKAAGIGDGQEVITVANTAVPTVSAIVSARAKPVFVDIDPETCLMDVSRLEAAITANTAAILPVHLYGQCVDMDPLLALARRYNLFVLEDCAQAFGATYKGRRAGALGDASAFSFYPTKVLGAYGDGGLIGSNEESFVARARKLRMYGMEGSYYAECHGYNSRLDELQAAILLIKLPHVERWIRRRRTIARRYSEELRDLSLTLPTEASCNRHVFYAYVVEHSDRDGVLERLADGGVQCNVAYRDPIHTMRGYRYLGYGVGDLPVTEEKAKRIFSLPMHPYLSDYDVDHVIDRIRSLI